MGAAVAGLAAGMEESAQNHRRPGAAAGVSTGLGSARGQGCVAINTREAGCLFRPFGAWLVCGQNPGFSPWAGLLRPAGAFG
jgi:hypothetical protein